MKKFILCATFILLSACAVQNDLSATAKNCPQVGIDVNNPDFRKKHKEKEIDKFYNCLISNLTMESPNAFEQIMSHSKLDNLVNGQRDNNEFSISLLRYQKTLYLQVANKEKKPSIAEQDWLDWLANENYKLTTIRTAKANARAIENSNMAIQQQQFQTNFQLQQIQQQQFMQNSRPR